jgi:histidinol-phosphatase
MNADWRNRYELAVEAARQAGDLALRYYQTEVTVEWKGDLSPVTAADREAEQLLRSTLLGRFPQDGFLGEESGDSPGASGFRWVIDPVDGTRSFVRGIPLWATLVGLEYRDEPVAGIMYAPALGDLYRALRGAGAFLNDRPMHVSQVNTLQRAHVYYSSVSWFLKAGLEEMFLRLVRGTERQRGYGDFYGFALVAQGAGELMLEWGCHVWDLCAPAAILCEAGGKLTSWDGTADLRRPDVLASNGLLHDTAVAVLREGVEKGRAVKR